MSFIFISYAREDQELARAVWKILTDRGIQAWMDTARLLPGQRWDPTIRLAINGSTGALFLASRHSLEKGSYVQQELDALLLRAAEVPELDIFLIVLRLDASPITDERLQPFHWASLLGSSASDANDLLKFVESAWKSSEQLERRKDREEINHTQDSQDKAIAEPTPYIATKATTGILFLPEELDIYVNKVTKEAFIFHGKAISYDISHLVYVPENHAVIVVMNDGSRLDLGVRIQWLTRPYFTRAKNVLVMHTKDNEELERITVPLRQGVLGSHGAWAWPSLRGLAPIITVGNAMITALFKEQRQEQSRERDRQNEDLSQEMRQAKVIAKWADRLIVGCLMGCFMLFVLALIGIGILIGKRL
jgi:TIR domain